MNKSFTFLAIIVALIFFVSATTYVDDLEGEFDLGTYYNSEYNNTLGGVTLSGNNLSGAYISSITDSGIISVWRNISWVSMLGPELSGNRLNETAPNGIDMAGNILLYHLDEESSIVTDYSGLGNDGNYTGTLYSQNGKINNAFEFDNTNDFIETSHAENLNFETEDFSIVFWINRSASGTDPILMKADPTGNMASSDGYNFFFTSTNAVRMRAQSDAIDIQTSTGSIAPGDGWVHVAIVGDRDANFTVYKNGVLMDEVDFSGDSSVNITSNHDMRIGYIRTGTIYHYSGLFDEVAFFNRTLSRQEVSNIYNRSSSSLNFSARSCNDLLCEGENFVNLQGNGFQTLNLSDNQYFQYAINFSTQTLGYSPIINEVIFSTYDLTEGASGTYYDNQTNVERLSFFNGTLVNLTFSDPLDGLTLQGNSLRGTFESSIYDSGNQSQWLSFNWASNSGELQNGSLGNVLLLHMDATALLDYSSYENNVEGISVSSINGKIGNALNFSSGSSIQVNDSNSLYNPFGMAVALWIRDDGSPNAFVDIISKYANLEEEWYLAVDKSNNDLIRFVRYGSGGSIRRDASSTNFSDGEWHFIVANWNGSEGSESVDLYFDNVEVDDGGADTGFGSSVNRNSNLSIGYNPSLNNQDLIALVDEVSVWNRSLSVQEIEDLYIRGLTQLNFSVRSCDDALCSGESYSDLITNDLSVSNNTYFQYFVEFETQNMSYLPILENVSVDYGISLSDSGSSTSISFVSPTPTDNTIINETNWTINFTVDTLEELHNISYSINNTLYDVYGSDLLLYYAFDNITSIGDNETHIVDLSLSNYNGTLDNGAYVTSSGRYSSGMYLDGTDDVLVSSNVNTLNFETGDFSMFLWIDLDDDQISGFIDKADPLGHIDSSDGFSFYRGGTGDLRFKAQSRAIDLTSSGTLTSSEGWTHIGIVADRDGNLVFYKNGQSIGSSDISGQSSLNITSIHGLRLGVVEGSISYYTEGTLDNVKVYDRVLSADEVEELYDSSLSYNSSSWNYYRTFNDVGNGTYDYYARASGNGFNVQTETRTLYVNLTTSNQTGGSSSNGTINITSPSRYLVFQRNESGYGNVQISGTYNSTETAIEARLAGGNWQTIASGISGGTFTGNLSANVSQGLLEVRIVNTTIVANVSDIGVGDVYAIAGQSNAEGRGNNAQDFNDLLGYNATVYREDDAFRLADDPVDTGTSIGSPWPILANHIVSNENIPIMFISASGGGSSILSWQQGQGNYNNLINQIDGATLGTNEIKGVLFFQGENDMRTNAGVEGNYEDYKGNLSALADSIMSDVGVKLIPGQTNYQPGGNRTTNDNVRLAQQDAWNESANMLIGATTYDLELGSDNLHFKTDSQLAAKAARWWAVLEYHFYNGTQVQGPKIQAAEFNTITDTLILTFDKEINVTSGTQGWYFVDGLNTLDDNNITSVNVNSNQIELNLDSELSNGSTVSLGSYNDGINMNVVRSSLSHQLPAELIVEYSIGIIPSNISFINPTPYDSQIIIDPYVTISSNIASNISRQWFSWRGSNVSFLYSDVVAYFNMNNVSILGENQTLVVDLSENGNDAVVVNGTQHVSSGRYDGAYYFDGVDDYMIISNDASLNFETENFAIELWVNRNSSNEEEPILTKTNPLDETYESSDGYALYFSDNNSLEFRAQSDLTLGLSSAANFSADEGFAHIILNVNRTGNISLHINGVLDSTKDISSLNSTNISSSYDLRIGHGRIPRNDTFTGILDEIRLHGKSLSEYEIESYYSGNLKKYYTNAWEFTINKTSLASGDYEYAVYAQQTDGVNLSSELRSLTVSLPRPYPIENLSIQSVNTTSLYWNWSNPQSNFQSAIISFGINGTALTNVLNTSNNYYNASGLIPNTTYTILVHTLDLFDVVNDTNVTSTISTLPDSDAPIILSTDPVNDETLPSGTGTYRISIITNEDSTCKYSQSSSEVWANMTDFAVTGNTIHNVTVAVSDGTSYNYYLMCEDLYSNRMNDTQLLRFVVSSSSGSSGSSGGGGGGGGGGGYSPTVSQSLTQINFTEIETLQVSRGQSEIIELEVLNSGTQFLNGCYLSFEDSISSWITHAQTEDIAPGQNVDFVFVLDIPIDAEATTYSQNFDLTCNEGNESSSFDVIVHSSNFEILAQSAQRDGIDLVVNYYIEDFSGSDQSIELDYTLLNSLGAVGAEGSILVDVTALTGSEEVLIFELPKDSVGDFILRIEASNGDDVETVELPITLESVPGLTGLAVSEGNQSTLISGLIVVLSLLSFYFVLKFLYKHHKRMNPDPNKKTGRSIIQLDSDIFKDANPVQIPPSNGEEVYRGNA